MKVTFYYTFQMFLHYQSKHKLPKQETCGQSMIPNVSIKV